MKEMLSPFGASGRNAGRFALAVLQKSSQTSTRWGLDKTMQRTRPRIETTSDSNFPVNKANDYRLLVFELLKTDESLNRLGEIKLHLSVRNRS